MLFSLTIFDFFLTMLVNKSSPYFLHFKLPSKKDQKIIHLYSAHGHYRTVNIKNKLLVKPLKEQIKKIYLNIKVESR